MTGTMRAVVIYTPGGPEVLKLEERPIPIPKAGEVLLRIHAFGLNRSEQVPAHRIPLSESKLTPLTDSSHARATLRPSLSPVSSASKPRELSPPARAENTQTAPS
jgi:hypothetical protein